MSATIHELNQHFIDLWWACDTGLPDLCPPYTSHAQAQNEKQLGGILTQVERMLSDPPRSREEARALQVCMAAAFRCLAEEALGFSVVQLDGLPSQAFSDVSEEFVRMARAFDPSLSLQDIYQAGRNAWTANGLQWLLGLPVQNTPAIFAYSLLYPYTDNYLDDPAIPASSKLAFNERFRRRLAGEPISPADSDEQVIFDLVAMIEKQYPRSFYPQVFESLLDIHRAQGHSLKLTHPSASPREVDVLGLSFEKGGTSVLADGYLVSGQLDEARREYTYGHGIFAQLLDDMEDVGEDNQAGRLSLYSQSPGHQPLDALANRTFHFGRSVLMGLHCFEVDESLREVIRHGADLLLIDTIGRTGRYYSQSYLRELEAHSPFRFSFLNSKRQSLFRRHGSLVTLMETVLLFS
jgi:hypothetical protein